MLSRNVEGDRDRGVRATAGSGKQAAGQGRAGQGREGQRGGGE